MKALLLAASMMMLHSLPLAAQGNWPYRASAISDKPCDCQCFRLGVEGGATLLSSWSQEESFTPPIPGSPLYLLESRNTSTAPGLGLYAGLDLDLRLGESWRLHLRAGYAHDRVVADDNQADVDITTSEGRPMLGAIQQTNARGTVDYVETSVMAEWAPSSAVLLGGQPSIFGGLALRARASELEWEWDEEIVNPAGATFLGSISRTRTQQLRLNEIGRLRVAPVVGFGIRWPVGDGISIPVGLHFTYWLPRVARDETVQDASRALTSGAISTVRLTGRDLQNWVSLRAGVAFDF